MKKILSFALALVLILGALPVNAYAIGDTKTILLNPNGGEVSEISKEVTIGEPYGELPEPTREGYTFKGWYRYFMGASRVDRFKPDAYGNYSIRISPPIEPFYSKTKVAEVGDTIAFDVSVEGANPVSVDVNDRYVPTQFYTIEDNRIYGTIPFDNNFTSTNNTANLDINCEEDYTDFTVNDYKLFKQTDKTDEIKADTIVEAVPVDLKAAWQSNSPHTHFLWKIRGEEPTCTSGGEKDYYHCYGCGRDFEDENGEKELTDVASWIPLGALGHSLGEWTVSASAVAPTCTAEGKTAIEKRKCSRCDYSESRGGETVAATGVHTYNEGAVSTKATIKNSGVKTFTCTVCGATATSPITKNNAKVKGKTAKVKFAKLKKKNQSVALKNAIEIKNAKGKVTYAKSSGNKKITINKTTGKITVKKGLKKGTYSVKVKVKMAGNAEYKAETKNVTVKIKVK